MESMIARAFEFVEDSQSEDEDAGYYGFRPPAIAPAAAPDAPAPAPAPATGAPATDAAHDDEVDEDEDEAGFKVGDLVEVETRTWPGINKIGGAARVISVYSDGGDTFVDVRYFLGGSEKRVDVAYVQPSDMHQKRARQRYSRVFFHDEFADEYGRKRRADLDAPVEHVLHPKPKRMRKDGPPRSAPEHPRTRIFDDDDGSSSAEDDVFVPSRPRVLPPVTVTPASTRPIAKPKRAPLNEDFFITTGGSDDDERVVESPERATTWTEPSLHEHDVAKDVGQAVTSTLPVDKYGADQPVEVENDYDFGDGSWSPITRLEEPQDVLEPRVRRQKRAKKRRYVGGYLEEADNFIQPEDNAMELPDDVRKDTGFRLGKTSKDLLHQYAVHTEQFQLVLAEFGRAKESLVASTLPPLALYDKVLELEALHALSIVREEDILDAILRKLDAKGKSIKPVENLQHDQRKELVNAYASWLRQLRDTTLQRLHREGLSVPSQLPLSSTKKRPASPSDSSSSDDDDYFNAPSTEPTIPAFIEQFHTTRPARPRASFSSVSTTRPKRLDKTKPSTKQRAKPATTPLLWDDVYHAPPHREQSALPWFFEPAPNDNGNDLDFSYDDTNDDRFDEPSVFIPRTLNSRTIPAAVLESTTWDWKALAKPTRRAAPAPSRPVAPATIAPAPKPPKRSRSRNVFEALWRHRQERSRPLIPFFPAKKSVVVPRRQPEPLPTASPPVADEPSVAPDVCVLDFVSDALPTLLVYSADALVRIEARTMTPPLTSSFFHEDAPIAGVLQRAFRTLRHRLCDLQTAEAQWLEQTTQSHVMSDEELARDEAALGAQAADCSHLLGSLAAYLAVQDAHHKEKAQQLLLEELRLTTNCLPHVASLLQTTPAYYYYLELTEAASTPLLSALTSVHAHCVSLVPGKQTQQAAALFLLEMHLHVPHFLNTGADGYDALWLQLMRLHGAEFWAFFTELLPQLRKIVAATFVAEASTSIDMLLRELVWDTTVALAPLFHLVVPTIETLHHWALVGFLLSSMDALPCSPRFDAAKYNYPLDKVERYRVRVLQRLLLLSSMWAPNHLPIVAVVLSLSQLASSHPGQCSCVASSSHACNDGDCPCLRKHVACTCSMPQFCSCRFPRFLIELATDGATNLVDAIDQCSSVELMGRVIAMQLRQLAKPVQRNRFRHPILTILKPAAVTPTAKWNWSGMAAAPSKPSAAVAAPASAATAQTNASTRRQAKPLAAWLDDRATALTQCTVFLSMALSTLRSQTDAKALKRDVGYYAKEILRFCNNELEYDSLALHALWLLARGLISVAQQCLSSLVTSMSDLLADMVRRLQEELVRPKTTVDTRVVSPVVVLQANIVLTLHCFLDIVRALKQLELAPGVVEDVANCLVAMFNSGLDTVLQASLSQQVPPATTRLALDLLDALLPPKTSVPAPAPVDEFDDPEELALLAALDMDALLSTDGSTPSTVPTLTFVSLVTTHVGEHVVKQLRLSLQKLVLHAPQTPNAIAILGGVLSLAPGTSWDLLLASTTAASLRLVFPRTFSHALRRATDKAAFVAAFAQTHRRDSLFVEAWLLCLMDATASDEVVTDMTLALAPQTPLLHHVEASHRTQVWRVFAKNIATVYTPHPHLLRSVVADVSKGWLGAVLDGATASLLELCVDRPQWAALHAFQDSVMPYAVYDARVLDALERGSSKTEQVVRYVARLYDGVGALLEGCGHLARGTSLVFHVWLRELFPSASYATHSTAAESLLHGQVASIFREKPGPPTSWFGSKLPKPWIQVVDVARTFLAVQHYPTLLNWFAQTASMYRLYEGGFASAPLRTLLYNLVDPDGPLGLASFYPIESNAAPSYKREADYFARGLFQQAPALRRLVLEAFTHEIVSSRLHALVGSEDWIPLLQLLWTCSSQATTLGTAREFTCSLQLCVEHLVSHLTWPDPPVFSPLTSVLHRQLLGFALNCMALPRDETLPDTFDLSLHMLVLRGVQLHGALQMPPTPPSTQTTVAFERLQTQLTRDHGFRFRLSPPVLGSSAGSGINAFRAQGDLLIGVNALLAAAKRSSRFAHLVD